MRIKDPYDLHNINIHGTGAETIVLAHGFGLDQSSWSDLLPALSERYQVVLFDLVGFTADTAEHYDCYRYRDLDGYVDDLLKILRFSHVRKCRYIGHSVSGMVGLLASIRKPGLFEQLVLIGSSPHYLNAGDYRGGFDEQDLTALLDNVADSYVNWSQRFAPAVVAKPLDHPAVAKFAQGLLAMRPDVALSLSLAIFRSDFRDRLDAVTVPCTLLQGRGDIAVPLEVAEYLHARIAGSTLEVIDAEGHVPQLSAPDVLLDALLRALRSGPTPSRSTPQAPARYSAAVSSGTALKRSATRP